ncbi:hypothetical protein A3D11_01790 [Candidatus Peribacteria bacterium RIFCSPHIGHO2_02_FULL_49_16]|nr:MAG: hypothetical protein A3D11_01790 [Candidatus Peribacteria bacterium RIFCSPHIGHO2_02_FULL_49_16]
MMLIFSRSRGGYMFLLNVLFAGAVAMTTATTLVLLGVSVGQNSTTNVHSKQAYLNAQTCIERALRNVQTNPDYTGDETHQLTEGSCTLLPVGVSDDERIICARGEYEDAVRRVEMQMEVVYPDILIDEWRETYTFTLCNET